jgi:hypothetical protein
MMYLAELSADGADSLAVDLMRMGRKVGLGWLQAVGYLARFGSVPSNERALAGILNMSVPFLRNVAWPLLEDRFVSSEDGKRYFCPEIRSARTVRARAKPPEIEPSPRHRMAANIRHHGNPWGPSLVPESAPAMHEPDASGDATADATRMQPDAKTDAKSTPVASGFASADAYFASQVSLARPDLLASPSFPDSLQIPSDRKEGSQEVSQDARAGGDAPDATADAKPDATDHAKPDATPGRSRKSRRSDVSTRITADWQPTATDRLEAQRRGLDPDEAATAFRDYFLGLSGPDALSPDWSARFRTWCRRELNSPSRQRHMTMAVRGGRAPSNGFDALALRDGYSGGYRGPALAGNAEPAPSNPVTDYLALEAKRNAG